MTIKNVVDRFQKKTAMAVVLRNVADHNWGWFSREDPRMHLQTVDPQAQKERTEAKVWLEAKGQRTFELAEGDISGPNLKKLRAKVTADRQYIETLWVGFMIENGWLKAEIAESVVTLTAYPGQHNAFTRKINLVKEFPGAYSSQVQPNWTTQVIYVSLDATTSMLAVGTRPKMDECNHIQLGPLLWDG